MDSEKLIRPTSQQAAEHQTKKPLREESQEQHLVKAGEKRQCHFASGTGAGQEEPETGEGGAPPSAVRREIIEYATQKKMFISQDAVTVIADSSANYRETIDSLETLGKPFIGKNDAEEQIAKSKTKISSVTREVVVERTFFRAQAKDAESDLTFLDRYDITGKSNSEGKIKNFIEFFMDKYNFLSAELSKRSSLKPKKISHLESLPNGEKLDIIGMVVEKWVTKNGNLAIRLEDPEGECIAIVKRDNSQKARDAENIINDDVIAVKASKISSGLVGVDEFFWPDLEQVQQTPAKSNLHLGLLSDAHVGSRLFLEKEFASMIKWLSGGSQLMSEKERELIGKIKYLVIAGDNIDGIGVYPGQFEELLIKDLYKQYGKFEEFVSMIPEYIEIIICPGQHDAVRRADPQPAIPKDYLPIISKMSNVHFVGSPSWFEVEGLKSIVYHGASLHELYKTVKGLDPREPEKAIIETLKRRDLMTGYGTSQPYVPEKKSYLLIRERPDLYFGGDMHHHGSGSYRGCTIMNGSTWQLQTDFQKEMGHVPTPGVFLGLDLKTRAVWEKKFY